MKRKIAAVIAAVALIGLGVAVAVGGAGEDPLVAKSYMGGHLYPPLWSRPWKNGPQKAPKVHTARALPSWTRQGRRM